MPNEFVARNGIIALNNSTITGSLTVTGGITGSLYGTASNIQGGTQYYVPVWTGATTLGTSSLYESGSVLLTLSGSTEAGLRLNYLNKTYTLGEYNSGNYTSIGVFDAQKSITLDALNEVLIGDATSAQNNTRFIVNDSGSFIKTSYGSDIGLKLDFANNIYQLGTLSGLNTGYVEINNTSFLQYYNGNIKGIHSEPSLDFYSFGDFNNTNKGTSLNIDDSNDIIIASHSGLQNGIALDYASDVFLLGRWQGVNPTFITIDNAAQIIKTRNSGNDIGLKLDFANNQYILGSPGVNSGSFLIIDDATNFIGTENGLVGGSNGLRLEFANQKYQLGQIQGGNTTTITVDDTINTVSISGSTVITGSLSATGLTEGSGSSHVIMYNTASGQFFFTASAAIGGGGGNASNDNFQQIFLLMGG